MNERGFTRSRQLSILSGLILCSITALPASAEPTQQAVAAFKSQVTAIEDRLSRQHQAPASFLATSGSDPRAPTRLRQGELIIEPMATPNETKLPGALLHHWRGTAFAPKATAADFERLLRDFDAYPQRFARRSSTPKS